jgi:hypothetical protein
MLLDEATAALDSESEEAIRQHCADKLPVVVVHLPRPRHQIDFRRVRACEVRARLVAPSGCLPCVLSSVPSLLPKIGGLRTACGSFRRASG